MTDYTILYTQFSEYLVSLIVLAVGISVLLFIKR